MNDVDVARSPGTVGLTEPQCWARLRESVLGRLAVVVDGDPDIFPVNHLVDGDSLVFRTGDGRKLNAAIGRKVAFETDGYDLADGTAWSVVLHGVAKEIWQAEEALAALEAPLVPWQLGAKPRLVRIRPNRITGRGIMVSGAATAARKAPEASDVGALVVVESLFGNTRRVADAVAAGLQEQLTVRVVPVEEAPTTLPAGLKLLVVGAPTHDEGLSTAQSRQAAAERKGDQASAGSGVREWIDRLQLPSPAPVVALFDTRRSRPWTAGSAAAQASALLSSMGFSSVVPRESFWVEDVQGSLAEGEVDRARAWGARMGTRVQRARGARR
jgi:uncharacterized protein